MDNYIAKQRAELTASSIIDGRSLQYSNKRLLQLLSSNMIVLDVGCGTGSITSGIAQKLENGGSVIGIDNNTELIKRATEKYAHIPNLKFQVDDVYQLSLKGQFDIVSCARVLQWMNNPLSIIEGLKTYVMDNGKILILDYNHSKIEWSPQPPPAFLYFYNQFMKWREDASMDNEIADKLAQLLTLAGFENIHVTEQHELSTMSEHDFFDKVNMWSNVMGSRGMNMVKDGYISMDELNLAKQAYLYWLHNNATSQKLYLLAVEGTKKKAT